MEEWKQLEQIIANIQRTIAPGAKIVHNERIRGRSGQMRQLDVTVRQTVGSEDLLIVIECKVLRRPVTIKDVETFIGLKQDVLADRGVMVSSSGYTKGARNKAAEYGITLLSYKDATTLAWSAFFGDDARLYFVVTTLELTEIVRFVDEQDDEQTFDGGWLLRTTEGEELGTYEEVIAPIKQLIYSSREFPLGEYECAIDCGTILIVETAAGPRAIDDIKFIVRKSARRYTTEPQVESGHILKDANDQAVYHDFRHRTDWNRITQTQPGVPLTPEEYRNRKDGPAPDLPYHVEMSNKAGILSVRLWDKGFRKPTE